MPDANEARGAPVGEIAITFLRLGITAFGGPAAHIAMMENELVRRRNWLTHERFLDLLGAVGIAACVATALGVDALLVLVAAGIATVLARRAARENASSPSFFASLATVGSVAAGSTAPASLFGLFLTFVKIGALVFGSGYVLLAFLRAELVDKLHWLSEPQLLDAVAVGQVTPGPVFTTATFIGFLIAGLDVARRGWRDRRDRHARNAVTECSWYVRSRIRCGRT